MSDTTPTEHYVLNDPAGAAKEIDRLRARLDEAEALIQDINAETGFGDLTEKLRDRMDAFLGAANRESASHD